MTILISITPYATLKYLNALFDFVTPRVLTRLLNHNDPKCQLRAISFSQLLLSLKNTTTANLAWAAGYPTRNCVSSRHLLTLMCWSLIRLASPNKLRYTLVLY